MSNFEDLIERAKADPEFRAQAAVDPAKAIRQTIETAVAEGELTEEDLVAVAGGTDPVCGCEGEEESGAFYLLGKAIGSGVDWIRDQF